jgi:hypothetical protein
MRLLPATLAAILFALIVHGLVASKLAAQDDLCLGVAPPPPLTDVVIDPNGVKYTGGLCAEGETCTPVPDDQPGIEHTPAGVVYTFEYVGESRPVELPGGGVGLEELVMAPTGKPPACWAWQWRRVEP